MNVTRPVLLSCSFTLIPQLFKLLLLPPGQNGERNKRKRTRSHLTQDAVIWRMLSWVTPAQMLFFLRQGDFGSPKTCQMGYTNNYTIPLSGQTILLWLPLNSSFDSTHNENIVFWGCLTTSGSPLCWMLSWWISLSFLRGVH